MDLSYWFQYTSTSANNGTVYSNAFLLKLRYQQPCKGQATDLAYTDLLLETVVLKISNIQQDSAPSSFIKYAFP